MIAPGDRIFTISSLLPLAFLPGALLLGSCGSAKPRVDTAKVVDSIRADEVRWNDDWRSGDPGKVAAHYAPNAVLMLPGAPPAVGTAAITATVRQATSDPAFRLTFSSDRVDVAASGDLAAAHGAYHMTATDPATKTAATSAGSFVVVYKPGAGGAWKAVWDIATPGPATPAPPVATH